MDEKWIKINKDKKNNQIKDTQQQEEKEIPKEEELQTMNDFKRLVQKILREKEEKETEQGEK